MTNNSRQNSQQKTGKSNKGISPLSALVFAAGTGLIGVAATYCYINFYSPNLQNQNQVLREQFSRPKTTITNSLDEKAELDAPKIEEKLLPNGLESKVGFSYTAEFSGPGYKLVSGYTKTEFDYSILSNGRIAEEILNITNYSTEQPEQHLMRNTPIKVKIRSGNITQLSNSQIGIIDYNQEGIELKLSLVPEEKAEELLKKSYKLLLLFKEQTGVDDKVTEWDGKTVEPMHTLNFDAAEETNIIK